MSNHINQLTLDVSLRLDGLVGQDVEYAPALAHYLTAGQLRAEQKVIIPEPDASSGLSQLQLVYANLPPLDTLDGSENFKFELLTSSRFSLVPEVDAKEAKHNEYTVNSGRISMPLVELLASALDASSSDGGGLERPLADPMLVDQETMKGQMVWVNSLSPMAMQTATLSDFKATSLYREIQLQCRKGTLRVRAHVDNPAALKAYVNHLTQSLAKAEQPNGPYNVNTQRFTRELEAHNEFFQTAYMNYYVMEMDGRAPRFDARANMPEAKMLHLTLDRHQDGHRPAVHYFRNRTKTELKEYPFSKRAIDYFESTFGSALLAVGMSSEQFMAAVDKQTASPGSALVHPETIRALRGVSYFAAKPAHAIYYSMDVSYKNPKTAMRLNALTQQAQAFGASRRASRLHQCALSLFGRAYCRSKLFRDNAADAAASASAWQEPARVTDYVTLGDRFSKDTMTGVSNTGDCDDMGGGNAMNNFLTPRQLHAQFGANVSRLLDAYVKLTDAYVPFGAGSMVTSAFFDESKNAAMSLDERRAIVDLPLKSSTAYQKAENGGHCHLLLVPRPLVASELKAAGQFSDALIAQVLGVASLDHFPAYEKNQPKFLVEGTGQVDGLSILAASEVHPSLVAEASALRMAKKLIQQSCPILRENFRGLASPFYATRPVNPDRATNSFFRVFEHLLSPTLYEADPRMGHFVVCDMSDRTRGVDAETYLRSGPAGTTTMALVSHLGDVPRQVLDKREELYACIDRQQALNITYRFKEDFSHTNHLATPYDLAMSRVGHSVRLSMFSGMKLSTLRLQLDRHALGTWLNAKRTGLGTLTAPAAGKSITASPEAARLCRSDNGGNLTLFIRPWHLLDMDLSALESELQFLRKQGVVADVDPVSWHERPLDACDDMLTLSMPLPSVKK